MAKISMRPNSSSSGQQMKMGEFDLIKNLDFSNIIHPLAAYQITQDSFIQCLHWENLKSYIVELQFSFVLVFHRSIFVG